jgi:anaerobic ribonucleoside-triphosphate reductase activating protein
MFADEGGTPFDPEALAMEAVRAAAGGSIEGVTLLGGEPFAQAAACARFAMVARAHGLSVMVFTGYTLAELEAHRDGVRSLDARNATRDDAHDPHDAPEVAALLDVCDLLVDGRFEQGAQDTSRRWVGSRNQVMHFRTGRYSPSDPRFAAPNTAELRLVGGSLTMNGWPALVPELELARRGRARSK